jgi:FAD:protein FMN transferase
VVLRGEPEGGRPWIVGIRHPLEADLVAARLAFAPGTGRNAVATSGLYERAAHIVNPRTGLVPEELLSMTVVGPSLAVADAYATTAFAMGRAGLAWLASRPGYAGYAIDRELRPSWNVAFEPYLAAAASRPEPALRD